VPGGGIGKLRLQDFQRDSEQRALRFQEKGGQEPGNAGAPGIPAGFTGPCGCGEHRADAIDRPLFRSTVRKTKQLNGNALTSNAICELVKRRLKDAGLAERLPPQLFRVTAIADLLAQGAPLEDVQYPAGHSSPRTTEPCGRRQKRVTRNIVERISI